MTTKKMTIITTTMMSFSARVVRLLRWAGLALALLMVSAASAQDAPIVTLEAGDFRALAVIEAGARLLVADAAACRPG
jgi:hypothetical protein